MNKIAKRIFALILVAALACSLFVALAACNKKDDAIDYSSLDGEISAEMQSLAKNTKNDLDMFVGYMLTEFEKGVTNSVDVSHYDGFESEFVFITIRYIEKDTLSGEQIFCYEFCFYYEEEAQLTYEDVTYDGNDNYQLIGNKVIYNKPLYDKIMSSNSKPRVTSKFDKQELDFLNEHMYEPTPEYAVKTFSVSYDNEYDAWRSYGYTMFEESDITVEFGLISAEEFEMEFEDAQDLLETNYTSDSYIKTYPSKGLVEYRLKEKGE